MGIRTPGLVIANDALYQLSYTPKFREGAHLRRICGNRQPRVTAFPKQSPTSCQRAPPPLASPPFMSKTASHPARKSANGTDIHRQHSKLVVEGYERAASRAMLHAVGFTRSDFKKSQIGIASTWGMVTPCNMHSGR